VPVTDAEKLAMCARALQDIRGIKGLVDGDWGDMVYAARLIATQALAGEYKGWNIDEEGGK
jgi:hypothetical protein